MSPAGSASTTVSAEVPAAGPGYGGSCFPKDTLAFLQDRGAAGVDQRIVRTTVEVNDDRKGQMVERVERALGGDVSGKRVAVLGLEFKPNTDDMREAPSIPLVKAWSNAGPSRAPTIRSRASRPSRWVRGVEPHDVEKETSQQADPVVGKAGQHEPRDDDFVTGQRGRQDDRASPDARDRFRSKAASSRLHGDRHGISEQAVEGGGFVQLARKRRPRHPTAAARQ